MFFPQDKKGELSFLAGLILLLVSVGVMAGIYKVAFTGADQKVAELNCRSFNAIRFAVEKGASEDGIGSKLFAKQFNAPRVCSTFERQGTVPTKDYQDLAGGKEVQAAYEIRDMMSRCWWMWLEGKQQNIFSKGVFDLNDGCFVCYTFVINKEANVGYSHLITALQKPYPQPTLADNCKMGGYGKCRASCIEKEQETRTTSCKNSQEPKCCTASFTYLDYLQGTNGAPTGKGLILVTDKEATLAKDKIYAVSIVSPKESWTAKAIGIEAAAIGVGVLGVSTLALLTAPVSVPILLTLGTSATLIAGSQGLLYTAHFSGEVSAKDYNYIMLSKYEDVQKYCYAEKSYGE